MLEQSRIEQSLSCDCYSTRNRHNPLTGTANSEKELHSFGGFQSGESVRKTASTRANTQNGEIHVNRVFYGNFDFEYQLHQPQRMPPRAVRRRNAELAFLWSAIADAGDRILSFGSIDDGFPEQLTACGLSAPAAVHPDSSENHHWLLVPWGWSPPVIDWAKRHAVVCDAPPLQVVREVNSRRFSVQREREAGCALPGTRIVTSVHEMQGAVRELPAGTNRWVVKAEWGMAARERMLGASRKPSAAVVNWAGKRFRAGQSLIVEPWVDVLEEAGLQFTVPRRGEPVLEGITSLLTDSTGVYRGSRFDDDASLQDRWAEAVDVAVAAVERIQSRGYFGPVGIDAVRYRNARGGVSVRPLQDVNARFTMGRLSLGFRRLLKPGDRGLWLHQQWPTDTRDAPRRWFAEFLRTVPAGVRVVRTSPFVVNGAPVAHGTVLLFWDELLPSGSAVREFR